MSKGCLPSWTRPLPCLGEKLRHLASTRRTSLGFWRQDVDRLILGKLTILTEVAARENQPLWGFFFCFKNKDFKLRVPR